MTRNLLNLAVRNVTNRGKRTWLTIIGVFIGIAAVVALVSLGQGLEQTVMSEFEDLGTDNLYIIGGDDLFSGFMSPRLEDRDVQVIERAQGVSEAGGMFYGMGMTTEYQGEEQSQPIIGIPTDQSQEMVMDANTLNIDDGREIRATDANSIMIGSNVKDSVFERDVGIRSQIIIQGERYRVIGILEPTGDPEYDRGIFTNLEKSREIYEADDDALTQIIAKVQPGLEPEEVQPNVEEELRRDRGLAPGDEDFQVLTAGQALEAFGNILNIVQAVVVGLASISLVVGAVGIMNTMYMSVTERVKEIGVMKSIGATNNQVRNLFLMESTIIGLIGGLMGIILGIIISEIAGYGIRSFAEIPFQSYYPPSLLIGTVIFSAIIGALSGYLPAKKAYTLKPVEALRDE